jgi:hypothetical protein
MAAVIGMGALIVAMIVVFVIVKMTNIDGSEGD